MKKIILTLLAATVFAGTLASTAVAAQIEVSGDAYVGAYSKYVWRGFDLSPDDKFVVQGGTDLSFGGFTVSFWGNMSENTGELNEVDVVLDYSTDLGEMVSVSVGNILYDVDAATDTNEAYLGLTLNVPLSPTLTAYYDYDEFDTTFVTFGLSHGIDLNDALSVSLGATAGYFFDDPNGYGTKQEWLHNLDLSVGADYAITDQISIGASALYSAPLSERAKRIPLGRIREEFTAGGAVTLAF